MYQKLEQVPDWAKPTVQKLVDKGVLTGDGSGNLNLSQDLTRTLVILDRLGVLEEKGGTNHVNNHTECGGSEA